MPQLIDTIFTVIAFIAPVYCVVRWNLRGVFLGAFLFWIILLIAGWFLSFERGSSVLDSFWLLGGWAAGLFYCFLIYGFKKFYFFLRKK
jgi:hypothetical protein